MKKLADFRWVLPFALAGAACSSILGIEDVHPGAKPGSSDGGENASGGTGGANGGTSGASGKGGTSGTSGATGGVGGDLGGTGGTAGVAGSGGEGDMGGDGGTGGGTPDGTVRGRLVTRFMQPIPNVTVMIGDEQADTNAAGEFEIPDVASEYDAKFIVNYDVNGNQRDYAWVYLGLTRRDPTLQVYNALTYRSGSVLLTPNDLTGTDFSNRDLRVAVGGPDGKYEYSPSLPNGTNTSSYWDGPESTNVTVHALLFEFNSDDLPTVYRSYDQSLAVFSETSATTLTVSVPDETVSAGTIAGTVTSASSSSRTNYVYLRFDSSATIQLVEHYGSTLNPASFSYTVPAITGASLEVAALEGNWASGPAAIVHQDGVAPGQMNLALAIPAPPTQVAPAHNTMNVTGATIFSWTSSAQTFVFNADNVEPTSPYGGMYVVTSDKQITIPTFPNGYTLLPGDLYNWRVETHGEAASVDELAGTDGFADSFAPYADAPESPRRGDGVYTISGGRNFRTAP